MFFLCCCWCGCGCSCCIISSLLGCFLSSLGTQFYQTHSGGAFIGPCIFLSGRSVSVIWVEGVFFAVFGETIWAIKLVRAIHSWSWVICLW